LKHFDLAEKQHSLSRNQNIPLKYNFKVRSYNITIKSICKLNAFDENKYFPDIYAISKSKSLTVSTIY